VVEEDRFLRAEAFTRPVLDAPVQMDVCHPLALVDVVDRHSARHALSFTSTHPSLITYGMAILRVVGWGALTITTLLHEIVNNIAIRSCLR
jgi:hypothetical protein